MASLRIATLAGKLSDLACERPDQPALHYQGKVVSFAELDRQSRIMAGSLSRLGIGARDRVALWLPNCPFWLIAFFALARLGASAVATNTRFRSHEIGDIFERAEVKAIVYWPGYRDIDFNGILHSALPKIATLEVLISYTENEQSAPPQTSSLTHIPHRSLLEGPSLDDDHGKPDAACLIFNTSGTTSKPKLVVHTQQTVLGHILDLANRLDADRSDACLLQGLPLCGTLGFVQALTMLLAGRPVVLQSTFNEADTFSDLRSYKVTHMSASDVIVKRLCGAQNSGNVLHGLKFLIGSRISDLLELSRRHGFELAGIYGSSEVHALFSTRSFKDDDDRRMLGGGAPVSRNARVRVRDVSTGKLLGHHESGELELYSSTMFVEYLNNPEATARSRTDDGYFRTGDLGTTSPDGTFTFLTRLGDSMRLSGFLVDPAEIEEFIKSKANVAACAIVAIESPNGPAPFCFFVADDESVTEASLQALCRDGIAPYKVPKRFLRVTALPMIESANALKMDRKKLREVAQSNAGIE